jgi:hypothetical protein
MFAKSGLMTAPCGVQRRQSGRDYLSLIIVANVAKDFG